MRKHISRVYHFLLLVIRRFDADNSDQTAASLTYTALLAFVPLLTIGLTIFSAFPAFATISASFKEFLLDNMVPETASKLITVYMYQFSENAGKLTAIGIVALGVTSLLLMQTIEHALNSIWHVHQQRSWMQRFVMYWAVLTLGPLLIGMGLYATSYLTTLPFSVHHQVYGLSLFGLKFVPVILTVTAMSLLYLLVPNRYVPTAHAWTGGLVAGLLFELMKLLFSSYISHFSSYTLVYGAFATLPLFLLWIYLSWMTVLLGATITAALPYYHNPQDAGTRTPGSIFYVALHLLTQLASAQRKGGLLTIKQLAATHTNWDQLDQALDQLTEAHWVLRSGKGWALAMNPDQIILRDVFERLVFKAHQPSFTVAMLTEQPKMNLTTWLAR